MSSTNLRALVGPGLIPHRARSRIERRLAAVLGLDVQGYSALMGRDEEDTHERVGQNLERVIAQIQKRQGSVFSFSGDGLMAIFPSAVLAVSCAVGLQAKATMRNARLPAARRIEFRIGINSGEVLIKEGRTGGDAVNMWELEASPGLVVPEVLAEPEGPVQAELRRTPVRQIVALFRS